MIERAPRHFAEWRGQLLSGRIEVGIAYDLGELLAARHVNTVDDPLVDAEFADVEAFIQLRPAAACHSLDGGHRVTSGLDRGR